MDIAYKIIFAVGVLYTFVSLLISGISGAFHFGSHIGHTGGHMDIGGHADVGASHGHAGADHGLHTGDTGGHHIDTGTHSGGLGETLFSWISIALNPIAAVSFLTIFGGIGILGSDIFKWTAVFIFFVALVVGMAAASLLYRYVAVPLYKSENSTHVSRDDLIGTPAEVISSIMEDGFGEIKYTVNSIRYTAPAKHIEGRALEQASMVVICKIENSVFYVSEVQQL